MAVRAGAGAEAGAKPEPSIELESVNRELGQSTARQDGLKDEVTALDAEARELSEKMIAIAARIQEAEGLITAAEERLAKLGGEESTLSRELAERRESLSDLLAGLQQLERNPPPPVVTDPADAVAAVRGAMLFTTVVPEIKTRAALLAQSLGRLQGLRASIAREHGALKSENEHLETERREIAVLHERKLRLMQATDGELERETARAAGLSKKAQSLRELIATIELERRKREAEAEASAQAAEARAQAEKAERERPKLEFVAARGSLEFPAQGERLRVFGESDGLGGSAKGLFIATRQEAQVTAPAPGRVEFAGSFRSYGQLLILDVGEGYLVLLAGLGTISAQSGQFVRAGEPVGVMGHESARGTMIGDSMDETRPILYVEFRKNGSAVDPSPWWIGARKEARG
ncbi:MAG: peptidoglycan DD-metalloendopeptidase family protein [Aestuariivirgaceae bacterium]